MVNGIQTIYSKYYFLRTCKTLTVTGSENHIRFYFYFTVNCTIHKILNLKTYNLANKVKDRINRLKMTRTKTF